MVAEEVEVKLPDSTVAPELPEPKFRPEEHFRNLKGQQYLEVKYRLVWFREEHPDGQILTEMIEHNAVEGLAVFRARVGFWAPDGREVFACGHGSETRKDFGDYAEKAETKSVGRALAMLGYGTAQAIELDEGEKVSPITGKKEQAVVDSPVKSNRGPAAIPRKPKPSRSRDEILASVKSLGDADPTGLAKLGRDPSDLEDDDLLKMEEWFERRALAGKTS